MLRKSFEETLDRLRNNDPTLTHLDFAGKKLWDVRSLAKALETNSYLTSLDISGKKIGPIGAWYLAHAIPKNATLKSINLMNNAIGQEGASYIDAHMVLNSTLTHLHIHYNSVGHEGAAILDSIQRKGCNLLSQVSYYISDDAKVELSQRRTHIQKLTAAWIDHKDTQLLDIMFIAQCAKYSSAIKEILVKPEYKNNRIDLADIFDAARSECWSKSFLRAARICKCPADTPLPLPEIWNNIASHIKPCEINVMPNTYVSAPAGSELQDLVRSQSIFRN